MKSKNYISIMIICFGLTLNVFSQTKQITHEDFYEPLRQAYKKMDEISRRITTQKDYYENGKVDRKTKITDEFLNPGKRHYLEIKTYTNRTDKKEYIQIGNNFYCKENDEKWKQSNSWCEGNSLSGLGGVTDSKYTLEDVEVNKRTAKLYTNFTTFKISDASDRDKGKLAYSQDKCWFDNKGFLLRQESKMGLLNSEEIYNRQMKSYEYNPKNIKIEAPIR